MATTDTTGTTGTTGTTSTADTTDATGTTAAGITATGATDPAGATGAAPAAGSVTWAGLMLDCPDAKELATFYGELTGWGVAGVDDEGAWAYLTPPGSDTMIGFQRVENYQAPRWPDQAAPQQFHLDFRVADLDASIHHALKLGASQAEFQPGGEKWRVLLDPAGHPFCLCPPAPSP